jgi:hypothetical protein
MGYLSYVGFATHHHCEDSFMFVLKKKKKKVRHK